MEVDERIAQEVIACWIEDCGDTPPNVDYDQLAILLHHVEVGLQRMIE